MAGTVAVAQAPPTTLPPSVEPGRIQQQFQPQEAPRAVPEISIPATPENEIPADAANVSLQLDAITVEGATLYSAENLAALTQDYVRRPIVLADLFRLADRITARYRADGFILSRAVVPAQRIGKTARITVVEGYVSEIHVDGYDAVRIEAYAKHIEASRPLRAADLERYMLLVNDLPGVTARAVLSPSPTAEGGALLTIVASHALVDGSFVTDNRGTRFIGPVQFYALTGINLPGDDASVLLGDGRIALRVITTPSISELRYGEFTLTQPLGSDGLRLIVFGSQSWSHPGYTLAPFNTRSYASSYSSTLAYPIIRSREQNLEVRAGFSTVDTRSVTLDTPGLPPSSDDHLRILQGGLTYDRSDAWQGINLVTLQASRGLPAFGASAEVGATPSRPFARSDFFKETAEISRQQDLTWVYPDLGLYAAATGQVSGNGALPSSQQFGLGGPLYGRAYDPSDVTGDEGWAAKAEVQYTRTFGGTWLDFVQPYVFADRGRVYRHVASVGSDLLASAGIGLRVAAAQRFNADFEVAKPITRDVSVELSQPNARPWRFFFSLSARF
jgi:hemolysin activation/secretion protein